MGVEELNGKCLRVIPRLCQRTEQGSSRMGVEELNRKYLRLLPRLCQRNKGGVGGMSVDKRGEVGDRASEGHAAGVYGRGFTSGSLARVGAKDGTWGPRIKVGFDKELIEVGRMAEDN